MRRLSQSQPDLKAGRRAPPKLTVYRLVQDRWAVEQTSTLRLLFSDLPGTPVELSGPLVVCGAQYGWRAIQGDLHALLDGLAYNSLEGPGDHLAFEDGPEDAA